MSRPIVAVCFARAKSSTAASVSLSDWLGGKAILLKEIFLRMLNRKNVRQLCKYDPHLQKLNLLIICNTLFGAQIFWVLQIHQLRQRQQKL